MRSLVPVPVRRALSAGLVVLALGLACGRAGAPGAGAAPDPTTAVRVLEVQPLAAASTVPAAGVVVAERSVVIRAETSGLVAAVAFDHGQRVRAGDVLVRLVDGEARARLAEADADVALARAQLGRARALFDRADASRAEVDRAEAEAALADARRLAAQDAVRRTVLRAPFAGVVGLREVVVGDLLQPGRAVTTLVDPSALAVDLALSERDLGGLAAGAAAEVTVDAAPGLRLAGRVSFVAPDLDAQTRTARVRVALLDADPSVRPGGTARVALAAAGTPGLRVPTQAVLATAKGPAVYVVGASGQAELRPVTTADRDADTLRVVEGLVAGDRVVVEGLVRLRPGAPVRVLE